MYWGSCSEVEEVPGLFGKSTAMLTSTIPTSSALFQCITIRCMADPVPSGYTELLVGERKTHDIRQLGVLFQDLLDLHNIYSSIPSLERSRTSHITPSTTATSSTSSISTSVCTCTAIEGLTVTERGFGGGGRGSGFMDNDTGFLAYEI